MYIRNTCTLHNNINICCKHINIWGKWTKSTSIKNFHLFLLFPNFYIILINSLGEQKHQRSLSLLYFTVGRDNVPFFFLINGKIRGLINICCPEKNVFRGPIEIKAVTDIYNIQRNLTNAPHPPHHYPHRIRRGHILSPKPLWIMDRNRFRIFYLLYYYLVLTRRYYLQKSMLSKLEFIV